MTYGEHREQTVYYHGTAYPAFADPPSTGMQSRRDPPHMSTFRRMEPSSFGELRYRTVRVRPLAVIIVLADVRIRMCEFSDPEPLMVDVSRPGTGQFACKPQATHPSLPNEDESQLDDSGQKECDARSDASNGNRRQASDIKIVASRDVAGSSYNVRCCSTNRSGKFSQKLQRRVRALRERGRSIPH